MELNGKKIHSVWEITTRIKDLLEGEFAHIYVEGEISGFTRAGSGHLYFNIKDDRASISCVMWRSTARLLRFTPENGLKVVCRGRISVYEPRGTYQLVLDTMDPRGVGDLQVAFEQLKKKLAAEGLFESDQKKPLPPYPERIGVITSPSGAAVQDILKVITSRWDNPDVLILPARVQGTGAAVEIADMIRMADRHDLCDVLIVGRGGGSMEDLWAFNEEPVARAIFESQIPIISAVGHEVDFTIADFVADVRAATPSVAAEIVIPKKTDLKRMVQDQLEEMLLIISGHIDRKKRLVENLALRLRDPRRKLETQIMRLDELSSRLRRALGTRLRESVQRVNFLSHRLAANAPSIRIREIRSRLATASESLQRNMKQTIQNRQSRLQLLETKLDTLSPLGVLGRGYAIVRRAPGGQVLRDATSVKPGEAIEVRLFNGELEAEVQKVKPGDKDQ